MDTVFKKDFLKLRLSRENLFTNKNYFLLKNMEVKYYYLKSIPRKRKKLKHDIYYIFKRFESLFGYLPKIYKLTVRVKNKKLIRLRGFICLKSVASRSNSASILEVLLINNLYFYIRLFSKYRHKYSYLEETLKPYFGKKIVFYNNIIISNFNLYFKWVDFSRTIIGRKFKFKFFTKSSKKFKKLRCVNINLQLKSNYIAFFFKFFQILMANVNKLVILLYKLGRNKFIKI